MHIPSILSVLVPVAQLVSTGESFKLRGGPDKYGLHKPKDPLRCKDIKYIQNSTVTFYGSPDNDPAWSNATAYDCDNGRGFEAGGDGSFENPLSFATADKEYDKCEIVYLPYIKKYLIHDDYCETCTAIGYKSDILTDTIAKDWKNGVPHVDIWTGGFQESEDGEKQIQCEEHLTPDEGQLVVRNPPHDLVANTKPLFKGTKCTKDVYLGSKGRELRCPKTSEN